MAYFQYKIFPLKFEKFIYLFLDYLKEKIGYHLFGHPYLKHSKVNSGLTQKQIISHFF